MKYIISYKTVNLRPSLADSITVVFQILTLTVLVRNQVGQQKSAERKFRAFFMW
jgi:hypothetical protein